MSYDFKRLTDVETISTIPDDAELFCVVDDEVKKVSKNGLGIKVDGSGSSINTEEFGAIYLRFPDSENDEDMEVVVDIIDEFPVIDWISAIIENDSPEEVWNDLNGMYNNGEQFPFVYRDNNGEIFNIEIYFDSIRADIYMKLKINFNETRIDIFSVVYSQQSAEYHYSTHLDSIDSQLEEIDSNGVLCSVEKYGKLTDKFKEETNIIGIYVEENELDNGYMEFYEYCVYEDDYFNNSVLKRYLNGGKIAFKEIDGSIESLEDLFDVTLESESLLVGEERFYWSLIVLDSKTEVGTSPFSVMDFLSICADESVLEEINDEEKEGLSHMFFNVSDDRGDKEHIILIPKNFADRRGYDYEHIQL